MAGRIVVEMSGEEQALLRSLRNVVDQQTKMAGGAKKIGDESAKAGKQMRNDFGSQALADIKNYAMGFFGVSQAIQEVGKALAFARQEAKDALASMKELTEERRALVQVSSTSKEFEDLSRLAEKLAVQTGMQRAESRELVFSAKSMGFLKDVEAIAEARQVIEPRAAAKVAGDVPAMFGGKITPLQALNMVLAAAEASKIGAEEFAGVLAPAAGGGAAVGASPAETAAALSVLAAPYGEAASAAAGMKGFGTKAAIAKETAGKGLMGALDVLQAMPEAQRRKWLGESQELNLAYQRLDRYEKEIRQRTAEVQAAIDATGTAESPLARKRAIALDVTTPEGAKNAAQRLMEQAERRREIARESRFAGGQAEREAAVADEFAKMDESRRGILGKWGARRASELYQIAPLPAEAAGPSMRMGAAGMESVGLGSLIPGIGQAVLQLRMFTETLNQTTGILKRHGQQQSHSAQLKERAAQRE